MEKEAAMLRYVDELKNVREKKFLFVYNTTFHLVVTNWFGLWTSSAPAAMVS